MVKHQAIKKPNSKAARSKPKIKTQKVKGKKLKTQKVKGKKLKTQTKLNECYYCEEEGIIDMCEYCDKNICNECKEDDCVDKNKCKHLFCCYIYNIECSKCDDCGDTLCDKCTFDRVCNDCEDTVILCKRCSKHKDDGIYCNECSE